jgi:hypothetical protein
MARVVIHLVLACAGLAGTFRAIIGINASVRPCTFDVVEVPTRVAIARVILEVVARGRLEVDATPMQLAQVTLAIVVVDAAGVRREVARRLACDMEVHSTR